MRLTRGQAIRAKCLDCMCGQSAEVRRCPSEKCPLYAYRMGRESRGGKTIDEEVTDEKTARTSAVQSTGDELEDE